MEALSKITPPLKYHGGKSYLASRIIAMMPPRCANPNAPAADDPGYLHYVEPYAGGLAVLLANDPIGISEVANDLNGGLVNFWNVLRCPTEFAQFQRFCEVTPFSEELFDGIGPGTWAPVPVDRAWRFFIRVRQSLAGRQTAFAPLTRNRTRRGMNEQASAWAGCVDGLPAVHARLRRVVITCKPAVEVIRQQDGPRTLFYIDPPYSHDTRATTGEYAHEMDQAAHAELLDTLAGISGRFILSGYSNPMYDRAAAQYGWLCRTFDLANHAAGGATKRRMQECCWTNYDPPT